MLHLSARSSSAAAAQSARPTASPRPPSAAAAVTPRAPALSRSSSTTTNLTRARAEPPTTTGGSGGGGGGAPPPAAATAAGGLSEDVLARLRAAEQEAARLREELAQVQSQQQQDGGSSSTSSGSTAAAAAAPSDAAINRIDSTDSRELPWTAGKRTAWLSEADVTFFTGAGATEGGQLGEAGSAASSAEEAGVVRRRLLQGALATAALAAFALVPTRALRVGAPSKPLFFYLIPLVRALDQLRDLEPAVEDADWPKLRAARAAIVGAPGNARDNLYDAVAALDSYPDQAAIRQGAAKRAEALAGEVVEALDALDYNKYFDAAMMGAAPSGSQNLEFVKFTREARKAAEKGLRDFLGLMPTEAVEGARQVVDQQKAAMAAM